MTYNDDFPGELKVDEITNWIYKLKLDLSLLYFSDPVSKMN